MVLSLSAVLLAGCIVATISFLLKRLRELTAHRNESVCFVVIVDDGATKLEGAIRMLSWRTAGAVRARRIVVIDTKPSEDSREICERLNGTLGRIEYRATGSADSVANHIAQITHPYGEDSLVYDLRLKTNLRHFADDVGRQLS